MRDIRKLAFAGLVCLTVLFGCSKPKGLQYVDTTNLNIQKLGLKESAISAEIKLYNPNNYKIKLKHAEMDISINDKFVGRSTLDTLMELPKLDTFLIPVKLKVDLSGLLSNALNVLLSNEVELKMEGKARLGKAGIFFDFPFSYQGKQKLKLF